VSGGAKDNDFQLSGEVKLPMILHRPDIVIARSVGILCIAGGFIIGMHGLDHPNSLWMPIALGLIATGLTAQIYALIRSLTYAARNKQSTEGKE